jgi:two-component system, LuxR family, sensor kinase FixL
MSESDHAAGSENGQAPLARPAAHDLDAAFRFYGRVTSDLVTIFDHAGRVLFCNAASERVLGRAPEECVGHEIFDFLHEEDRAQTRAAFARWSVGHGESSFLTEARVVSLDGEVRFLHWTVAPYREPGGGMTCFISHARDVTPQVRSAMRVQRSEVRHRAVLAGLLDPVLTIDGRGTVLEATRSVESIFGYRPEELIGKNIKLLMAEPHSSRHDGYLEHYRATGQTGILGRTRQFDVRRKDGSIIQIELSVSRVDVPGEAEPLFVGSFRDVSARLRAEQALAENEARMRAIFDQEYELVGLLSREGVLLEINHSALRGIGATREDVVGRVFWETPWWSKDPERRESVRRAVAAAAAGEFVRFEVEYVDNQGEQRWVDFSLKPVRDAAGQVQFLLPEGREITPFKAAHARELAMQDALAQIGESASLLAHEIKNPITAINFALRAVADKLGEDQRSVLEDLTLRLTKLERTMRRTLSFARPLKLERESCDVGELLSDVVSLLGPELQSGGVRLELECAPDLPCIQADRGLLEEVILNLVRNAHEALAKGGRVRVCAAREGRTFLEISVDDDGPGIAPAVRASLFKPFVTSKLGGTGLGLAIARKIVREHGGEIGVREGVLGGACFWIRLPTARERSDQGRTHAEVSA